MVVVHDSACAIYDPVGVCDMDCAMYAKQSESDRLRAEKAEAIITTRDKEIVHQIAMLQDIVLRVVKVEPFGDIDGLCDQIENFMDAMADRAEQAEVKCAAYRAALQKAGHHCRCERSLRTGSPHPPCTCGRNAALADPNPGAALLAEVQQARAWREKAARLQSSSSIREVHEFLREIAGEAGS